MIAEIRSWKTSSGRYSTRPSFRGIIDMKTEITRRTALKTAAGLGLSFLVPALEARAAKERGPKRQKSLIVLWMAGGPSQLETWDPHPQPDIPGFADASKRIIENAVRSPLRKPTAQATSLETIFTPRKSTVSLLLSFGISLVASHASVLGFHCLIVKLLLIFLPTANAKP